MKKYFCPVCLKPKPIQWCQQHGNFFTTQKGMPHRGSAFKRANMVDMLIKSRGSKGARHRKEVRS